MTLLHFIRLLALLKMNKSLILFFASCLSKAIMILKVYILMYVRFKVLNNDK